MNQMNSKQLDSVCPSPTRHYVPKPLPGTGARIGLITLATDSGSEPEWWDMVPGHDVALYVSRIQYDSNCTPESLRAMGDDMTRAASMLPDNLYLDAIAYSCTSGTTAIGHQNVVDRIQAAHPGVPVATPISGACGALKCLGASKVAVVTPYTDIVNETIQAYLENEGLTITGMVGFSLIRDEDLARLPLEAIMEAIDEVLTPESEAIFLSCTGLVVVNDIPAIEEKFGLPVITSNQAMFWEALRASGYTKPIKGFGRLLSSAQQLDT